MKKLLLLVFIFISVAHANFNRLSSDAVRDDFKNSQTDKYRSDDLPELSETALVERGIIKNVSELTRAVPAGNIDKGYIRKNVTCAFVKAGFTATIYEFNPLEGTVTCMVAEKGDLYNPVGTFTTNYPDFKKRFARDLAKAEADNKAAITAADEQFKPLKKKLTDIYNSSVNGQSAKFLTIPEVLTAAILTDTDIIDVENTTSTNKLQLKTGYTSKYLSSTGTTDSNGNKFSDNKDYILVDAKSIFDVYSGLSDVSMIYLVFLVAFFGIVGIGKAVLAPAAAKLEDKVHHDKVAPYITGIASGILLFFPTDYTDVSNKASGDTASQYTVMKTQYQEFEKVGYGLFTDWAKDSAKVIIDAEMRAIVDKSGVGTKSQIIDSAAGYQQYNDLANTMTEIKNICRDDIYDYGSLSGGGDSKNLPYSSQGNSAFPTNEKWAYAASIVRSKTLGSYYKTNGDGEVKNSSSYNSNVLKGGGELSDYYPEFSLSACGKAWYKVDDYSKLKEDNHAAYTKAAAASGGDNSKKIAMLEGIVKFQYELYRDWGYLAILGLPVTKMQTEYIGGLYKKGGGEVLDKLNDDVSKDGEFTHTIMSSIPYMMIPGASTVYQIISDNGGKLGAAVGATAGAPGGLVSALTGFVGGVIGSITGSAIGMVVAYKVATTTLSLLPIVGIIIIGLVRFIVILVKIFTFHFASLFLMPIMFAKENLQAISSFSLKIFATMLELPIFVLSVWLAITANSLIHTVGDVFGKKMVIGMLDNSKLQFAGVDSNWVGYNGGWLNKLSIYLFDGFIEVAIAIFSIAIIYKLLISLHNSIFELFEVVGSRELDGAIESMKQDAGSWGAKI